MAYRRVPRTENQSQSGCEKLDTSSLTHEVLRLLSDKIDKNGMSKKGIGDLIVDTGQGWSETTAALRELELEGFIERIGGTGGVMKMLIKCDCGSKRAPIKERYGRDGLDTPVDRRIGSSHAQTEVRVTDENLSSTKPVSDLASSSASYKNSRFKYRKVSKSQIDSTYYISTYYFPKALRNQGIVSGNHNAAALTKHLNFLKEQEVPLEDIKLMIDIFAKRGEQWCKGKAPWIAFKGKTSVLLELAKTEKLNQRIEQGRTDVSIFAPSWEKNK